MIHFCRGLFRKRPLRKIPFRKYFGIDKSLYTAFKPDAHDPSFDCYNDTISKNLMRYSRTDSHPLWSSGLGLPAALFLYFSPCSFLFRLQSGGFFLLRFTAPAFGFLTLCPELCLSLFPRPLLSAFFGFPFGSRFFKLPTLFLFLPALLFLKLPDFFLIRTDSACQEKNEIFSFDLRIPVPFR